jgi:hypothetical protein
LTFFEKEVREEQGWMLLLSGAILSKEYIGIFLSRWETMEHKVFLNR